MIGHGKRMRCTAAAALAALLAAAAPVRAENLGFGSEVGVAWDNNLNNGRSVGIEREDAFGIVAVDYGRRWLVSDATALEARLGGRGELYQTFEGLSQAALTGTVRLVHRPGRTFHAPFLELAGSAAMADFRSDLRDRRTFRVVGVWRQPLTTAWSARVQAGYAESNADDDVFDMRTASAMFELEWLVTNRLLVYANYDWQDGDLVSTGTPPPPVIAASSAVAPDDAFAPLGAGELAYRLDGETQLVGLGFNWRIEPWLAFDLLVRHADAKNELGVHYRREQAIGSLLLRF